MIESDTWTPERALFKAVTANANILAWATQADGSCYYLSPQWYQFTGRIPGESEGFNWLMSLHPGEVMRVSQAFFDANERQVAYVVAYRLQCADGSFQPVSAVGLPKFNLAGVFEGFFGIVCPLSQSMAEGGMVIHHSRPAQPALTPREREVLRLIAEGQTTEVIAVSLGIASRTVEAHVSNAGLKLGGVNRAHTVAKAIRFQEI
ncbi:LuxR C-terminal-related transcriptional regulator [Devosia sediminis]|uniref:PAS domain-containing protein n=1 Tax=Devosia sediminis TaxID=2798801 RepID=A0A934ITY9_9HYPH|nr:LuxR C-terminal-related transcriptional regulator [Devosia sediminis]MBJ3786713.1 PAS domain-containing protein [Devosia sediminis]